MTVTAYTTRPRLPLGSVNRGSATCWATLCVSRRRLTASENAEDSTACTYRIVGAPRPAWSFPHGADKPCQTAGHSA
ncbi:MAG: hypothetical protein DLM61_18080 [Pseudonocardiales bacterium]|nr:MAG: hypothetical protein DLM61_18080 [Pseudonocardiales bacterium]